MWTNKEGGRGGGKGFWPLAKVYHVKNQKWKNKKRLVFVTQFNSISVNMLLEGMQFNWH